MSRISLSTSIASRDGTLTKDAKLLNCFSEPNRAGGTRVVKRAGLTLLHTFSVASLLAQGLITHNTYAFVITNNTLQEATGAFSMAIPAAGGVANIYMSIPIPSSLSTAIKSTAGLWIIDNALGVTKVTDADYPITTVPGMAYIDGTFYVMAANGDIMNSALDDPLTWTALGFITPDTGIGAGVALYRHLNYVAAFCTHGIQFFYDAGNPGPGTPLSPSGNANFTIGCASAYSIQNTNELTIFMSQEGTTLGRSISALSGLAVVPLSTPEIDRVLNLSTLATVYSFVMKVQGHSFYGLTLSDLDLTLVLDVVTGEWAQWASTYSGADHAFRGAFATAYATGQQNLFLDVSNGQLSKMVPTIYQDIAASIHTEITTPSIDGQSMDRKQLSTLFLAGDTVSATVSVSYSDDDYATFNTPRAIDMSTARKVLQRLGSFYRRAFRFSHTANTPLRLEGFEFPVNAAPDETGG